MRLNFSRGIFKIPNPNTEFNSLLEAVPTARWNKAHQSWHYSSSVESKKLLLLYWKRGLLRPSELAKNELLELEAHPELIKSVASIKEESTTQVEVPLKVELFQHQKKAYKIGTTLSKVGLLMEQGTGKTLASLAIAGYRYRRGEVKRLLIVAPKSTLKPWEEEILNYVDYPVEVTNLDNRKKNKKIESVQQATGKGALQIILINYQSVWRIFTDLARWKPDMIICDESQKIKNGRSKQAKALHKLGDNTKFKQILSGTPVTQGPMDVWSQYRFLDSDIFGKSFPRFRDLYAVMGGFKGYQVVRYKNLDELSEKAHSIAYRVRKVDTDIDLPPITNQYLYCEIGKEARKYYRDMDKNFRVTLKDNGGNANAPIVLTQLLRLQQIAGGFLPTEEGKMVQVDSSKLTILSELVEDLPKDKKLVIFARFLPEVAAIREAMLKVGRGVVTLTGATKDRGGAINVFQSDPNTPIMVAQIQTGGVGLNLQVADTIIFYSTNFSYGDYDQAKARVHRIGQTSSMVTYIHLVSEGTVDEVIMKALEAKKDVADYIVDHTI